MPGNSTIALESDHSQVELVAEQVGIREAARQFNLSEDTVKTWAFREQWTAKAAERKALASQASAILRVKQGMNPVEPTALDALANYSGPTRLGHAVAAKKLAEKYAQMDADELHESVPQLLGAAKHASITHNWNQQLTNVGIRLDLVAGAASVDVQSLTGGEELEELEE